MGIDEALEVLKAHGISKTALFPGYTTLPKDHVFVTYGKLQKEPQGSDGYVEYWVVTYQIRFFYRENKTVADWTTEEAIEQDIRTCEDLKVSYDYNDTDKLEMTFYEFTVAENF